MELHKMQFDENVKPSACSLPNFGSGLDERGNASRKPSGM